MVQAGVPIYEVGAILGHTRPDMTARYAHLQPEHLKRAVSALDQAFCDVSTSVDTRAQ